MIKSIQFLAHPVRIVFLLLWVSIGCSTSATKREVRELNLAVPTCQVTVPNGRQPPVKSFGGRGIYHGDRHISIHHGHHPIRADRPHGNGKLWTVLPPDGKLMITPEGGTLRWKFPWWRAVRGQLTIVGRRLDEAGGQLKADIPTGYGETRFQASGVFFPSEGCWEITGIAGGAALTFVVEVRAKR